MAEIKKIPHAIDVAERFTIGVRVLIDDYGDAAKWKQDALLPCKELGAYMSRVSQLVQLSYYAVELMLKVLYQQDHGKPFAGGRDHLLAGIFTDLKEETQELIEFAYAERGDEIHGDLFKYPHSEGTALGVILVCDGKYNLYRYNVFEMDDTSVTNLSYDFAIVDVLQALATIAKTREPEIMAQYTERKE